MILAVTGGTGFVGQRLIDLAVERGHEVRALTRRPQDSRDGRRHGSRAALESRDVLEKLVTASDAVIHVAGVINARDAAGFEAGNVTGTAVDARRRYGCRHEALRPCLVARRS